MSSLRIAAHMSRTCSRRALATSCKRFKQATATAERPVSDPTALRRSGEQSARATEVMKDRTLAEEPAADDQARVADTKRVNHGRQPFPGEQRRHRAERPSAILMPHDKPSNVDHVGQHRIIRLDGDDSIAVVNGGIIYTVTENGHDEIGEKRKRTVVSYARLRDACTCPKCVDTNTRQKSFRSSAALASHDWGVLPERAIRKAERAGEKGIHIDWPSDGHQSFYSLQWLTDNLGAGAEKARKRAKEIMRPVTWSGDQLWSSPNPVLELSAVQNDASTRHGALLQLQKYGYLKLVGVPTVETSDAFCALRQEVAPLFGEIRNTFYGPTWDVKSLKKSRNVAYTDVDLGLHMDLLYFQNPPRFQLLHCLRNRVHGGESYFVDSFRAAEQLLEQDPASFHLLAQSPIGFHYDNDGYHYRYAHPTIELVSDAPSRKPEIKAVNYSPPFQAWHPDVPPKLTVRQRGFLGIDQCLEHDVAVLKALERFEHVLDDDAHRVEYTLKEGECVVFDNRRVLHARRRFWDREGAPSNEPTRWLKGCYIDGDAVWNALRYTDRKVAGGEIAQSRGWDGVLDDA